VPIGGYFILFHFFLLFFGDFILHTIYIYIYIYSCILLVLADGTVHLAVEQRKSRSPIIRVATVSS